MLLGMVTLYTDLNRVHSLEEAGWNADRRPDKYH